MDTIGLAEAIAGYLRALSAAERSPAYISIMSYSLRHWVAALGNVAIASAVLDINGFLSRRLSTLSHNTACSEWRRYKQAIDYFVSQHWVTDNPLRAIRAPRARDTDVDVLTDEQLQSLLAHADAITRTILIILLGSGMRLGELEKLRWSDVHGDELVLHGKGDKVRRVAPGKAAMTAITALPRTQATVLPFGRSGIDYHLRQLAKRAHIPLHAHQIRHTFADRFIREGTVEDLAHILGHSNLATTMIYVRRHQQERALLAQRKYNPADALLGGTPRPGRVVPFRGR